MSNKFKHLTLNERRIILEGIRNGASKVAIANTLGKDKSTIGKEIKQHRVETYKCQMPLECSNYKKCKYSRECHLDCVDYVPFKCKRRDRSPGACNGCDKLHHCRFNKMMYKPEQADQDYKETLVSSRIGVNATLNEIRTLGEFIKPLLKQGQSFYHIVENNPDLGLTERTLYNYVENDVFKDAGVDITNMSLRRKVNRKLSNKKGNGFKKRKDRSFLNGRKHEDYLAYLELNPNASVVEMDTVYNDGTNGPFIQTFKFLKYTIFFGILHAEKTQEAMNRGVALLEQILGSTLFKKTVEVILTDRGTEFSDPDTMETSPDGTRRTRVYYCDPMASHQKGSIENNHIELRMILPKGVDLRNLGLIDQNDLNKVLSHINSYTKEKLDGKSPFEILSFFNPELYDKLMEFGLEEIEPSSIILKPYLIKK